MIISAAAKRYAIAILDLASEAGATQRVREDLETFCRQMEITPELRETINNPAVSRDVLVRVAVEVARRLKLSELAVSFLALAASRRRLKDLRAIISAYAAEQDTRLGRARGEVISAGPIRPDQVERIRVALGKVLGRQLELTKREDPSLLMGLRVVVNDRVFDLSARTWLGSLRSHLLENR